MSETQSDEQRKLRKRILGTVDDAISDLLFYNRKEDDELPVGAIEQAITDGIVTREELVERFAKGLR